MDSDTFGEFQFLLWKSGAKNKKSFKLQVCDRCEDGWLPYNNSDCIKCEIPDYLQVSPGMSIFII